MWKQLVAPDLTAEGYPGYCLGFTQKVYGAPGRYPNAWEAWLATNDKHETRELPPVSVPVWFDGYSSVEGVYARYGHVCAYVPGIGFLNQGEKHYGQKWYSTLEEVERVCNVNFVGFSTDLNGLEIAAQLPDPTPKRKKNKMGAFYRSPSGAIVWQEKPNTKVTPIDLTTWIAYAANGNAYGQLDQKQWDALIKKWGA